MYNTLYTSVSLLNFIFAVFIRHISLCLHVQISRPCEVVGQLKYYALLIDIVFGLKLVSEIIPILRIYKN